ncbi:cytochrome b/b6 domain-containing protein [Sphingobium sufflavum]|nr:cytochrome b/b6 domain-containing protein [Sphingobium sufflavum]
MGAEGLMAVADTRIARLRQYVWDAPTRLFHWLLVGLLGFSWYSAETYQMEWHRYSGLAILGLVAFRIVWGFVGSGTARFGGFLKGPRAALAYLRSKGHDESVAGHNPLGGWSVALLLLLLTVQTLSGLFAVDIDGIESGPLSYLVDFDRGRQAAAIHGAAFALLKLVAALHVAAILFYLVVKRRNLITPMLTGYRRVMTAQAAVAPASRIGLIVAVAVGAGVVALVYNGLPGPLAP